MIPDILSRSAYPASQAYIDTSKNVTIVDLEEMEELIHQEKEDEKSVFI